MIPDEVVDEVRARADIVDVVGDFVSLKRSGKDWKAPCPFHDDRTPSFYVVPSKGFYTCFGCGESGDVFSFVMKKLGLDFVEAVKHVGAKAGVEVREVRGVPREDPLEPLYGANAFARDFYRERLWQWEGGEAARRYLDERGIGRETAERFELGYAPDEWRALRDSAARHGIDDDVLEEVGLLVRRDDSREPYDRFRHRVVFPIEGLAGKVVAFGGRVLPAGREGQPKYLNSPETPVYHKGEVLYGLSRARHAIRREGCALVVEGYMDVVSLAAAGIDNAVATLGTALTDAHARLLSRYAARVLLLFDSDPAGLKATFRAGDALLAAGLQPSVVTLPPGEDPDSLVRKEGGAGLRSHLDQAVDVLDRKLQILEERSYFSTIERVRGAVDRLLPTLRAARDPALRDIYVSRVSERTGVRRETLEAELVRDTPEAEAPGPGSAGRKPRGRGAPRVLGMGAERKLLLLLLHARDWIERAAERLGPHDFLDASYRTIFEALVADPNLERATPEMDSLAARRLEDLLGDPEELSQAERVFEECVRHMQNRPLARRAEELRGLLRAARDPAEQEALARELDRLLREGRETGADWSAAARRTLRVATGDSHHNPGTP